MSRSEKHERLRDAVVEAALNWHSIGMVLGMAQASRDREDEEDDTSEEEIRGLEEDYDDADAKLDGAASALWDFEHERGSGT